MATNAERATAIVGAVINGTPTNAQVDRVGAAVAFLTDQSAAYAAMTQGQRAAFIVAYFRATVVGWVQTADVRAATLAAQSTAAADLPEAPG